MDQNTKTVVLVADDEPSTLAIVSSHLRSKGFSVLEASDGDQAWELAHEHLPHLVVLDVMMPGMSGWEVCRKIREAVSLAHTGVIMLTGIGENLNEMTSPLYGADAHVDKPFNFGDLDRKITATLKRRQAGAVGRADEDGKRGSSKKKGEKKESNIERPTLRAAAEPPSRGSARRLERPMPPVKTKPLLKQPAEQQPSAKSSRSKAGSARNSSRQTTSTKKRTRQAPAQRQVRTSTMKEKPRAKTAGATKPAAAKSVAKKAPAKAAAAPKKAAAKAAPKKATKSAAKPAPAKAKASAVKGSKASAKAKALAPAKAPAKKAAKAPAKAAKAAKPEPKKAAAKAPVKAPAKAKAAKPEPK
ncbi:MAG: response regulator transcription factor, partial [Myxococcota bacterium]